MNQCKMEYECHVTCLLTDGDQAQRVATEHHWVTSEIERDPLLGKDSYFYLTTHDDDIERMFRRMSMVVEHLKEVGVFPVRQKIELIIYDTKKKLRGRTAVTGIIDEAGPWKA